MTATQTTGAAGAAPASGSPALGCWCTGRDASDQPTGLLAVADYVSLGSTQPIPAAPDTTGANTGNLTTIISQASADPFPMVGQSEIYHMVVRNVPPGGRAVIRLNQSRDFGFVYPNTGSEWWGIIYMNPGTELDFFWSIAASVTPVPLLTVFWRYDISLPANRNAS